MTTIAICSCIRTAGSDRDTRRLRKAAAVSIEPSGTHIDIMHTAIDGQKGTLAQAAMEPPSVCRILFIQVIRPMSGEPNVSVLVADGFSTNKSQHAMMASSVSRTHVARADSQDLIGPPLPAFRHIVKGFQRNSL